MFLFSPKRTATITDSFINRPTENLTNKLFHSIQTDLTLLTETKQDVIVNRGTYV